MERTQHKDHEDRIAGKGFNSFSHYNLVRKFFLYAPSNEIPDAKAAVGKEWEKLEKMPAWQVAKVKRKREVIQQSQKEQRTVHFATLMDSCHLKNVDCTAR